MEIDQMLGKLANSDIDTETLTEGSIMSAPQTNDSSINGQVVILEA